MTNNVSENNSAERAIYLTIIAGYSVIIFLFLLALFGIFKVSEL